MFNFSYISTFFCRLFLTEVDYRCVVIVLRIKYQYMKS